MDVQNVRNIHVSVRTKATGNSSAPFKMAESEGSIFLCVKIEIDSYCQWGAA